MRSPRTLYDLRRAYEDFPEQVDAWCASGVRITRDAIKALVDGLRHDVGDAVPTVSSAGSGHVQQSKEGAAARDGSGPLAPASGQTVAAELRHDVIPPPLSARKPVPTVRSHPALQRPLWIAGHDRTQR